MSWKVIKRLKETKPHKQLVEIGIRILRYGKFIEKTKYWSRIKNEQEIEWSNRKSGTCKPIYKEPQNVCGILPDVIGWQWLDSYVIECKTSRADFLNDKKKKGFAGKYFSYLTYPNIIKADELTYQGLFEYDKEKGIVNQIKPPEHRFDYDLIEIELAILLSTSRGTNYNSKVV